MLAAPFSVPQLRQSVIAVPPLARDAALEVCRAENEKIIHYLEAGGIRSLLYGGNAIFYHMRLSEYGRTLEMLAESTGDETVVIPSFGPSYGVAMDQVDVIKEHPFPTAMLLPSRDVVDQQGIATGVRYLAEKLGKPLVLYLKFDRWLDPALIRSLESDGVISWIKYAVVRDDPSKDDYLRRVQNVFPSERIISGIGEQPAIVHLRQFGLAGFTSGCVCVAPERSMEMMHALHREDDATAEQIRRWFEPLEDVRNEINPIRVLHYAVSAAGIADTGPMLPMLGELSSDDESRIRSAVATMRETAS